MEGRGVSLCYSELSELDQVAGQLLLLGGEVPVWLFLGEMGVGKTTLIKKICEKLGVASIVQSPTFSIVNEYAPERGKPIYHFDFYRLKNENEAYDIGVEEYLFSGNYCFMEWPEKIEALWPEKFFEIKMEQKPDGSRVVEARIRE